MDATFWALIALVLFFCLLFYAGVPKKIFTALDDRADKISKELEEARHMCEEAQALLAEYTRKREMMEQEAKDILEQAEFEARRMTQEAEEALNEMMSRKTKLADEKIRQAEQQAIQDVRFAATQIAIEASRKLLRDNLSAKKASKLLDDAIADLPNRLN